jgi:hypothetical protein
MIIMLLDRAYSEQQLSEELHLDLRNIESKVWPKILSSCKASALHLYNIKLKTLDGIESLIETKTLELEWATKVEELLPVFKMQELESLSVYDFPKLENIDGIESLSKLKTLNLSGSRGALTPKLCIKSIVPVSKIPNLTSFSLANASLGDDDVMHLAKCKQLQHLNLSNQFDRVQLAYLAKHLNKQLVKPLESHITSNIKCKTCGEYQAMFIGRSMPMLCHICNDKRFKRHVDEFNQLVSDA